MCTFFISNYVKFIQSSPSYEKDKTRFLSYNSDLNKIARSPFKTKFGVSHMLPSSEYQI